MPAKLTFEGGRVQIETDGGCAIWLDDGDALMASYLITERLSVPGDGDGHVIPACLECGHPANKTELWCDAHGL